MRRRLGFRCVCEGAPPLGLDGGLQAPGTPVGGTDAVTVGCVERGGLVERSPRPPRCKCVRGWDERGRGTHKLHRPKRLTSKEWEAGAETAAALAGCESRDRNGQRLPATFGCRCPPRRGTSCTVRRLPDAQHAEAKRLTTRYWPSRRPARWSRACTNTLAVSLGRCRGRSNSLRDATKGGARMPQLS